MLGAAGIRVAARLAQRAVGTGVMESAARGLRGFSSEGDDEGKKVELIATQRYLNLATKMVGRDDIYAPDPCDTEVIQEGWITDLMDRKPVQNPNACFFCVGQEADRLVGKIDSFFDRPSIAAVMKDSANVGEVFAAGDTRVFEFFKQRLQLSPTRIEFQKPPSMGEREFVVDAVGHEVHAYLYTSAKDIQTHLSDGGGPLYSMIQWGLPEGDAQAYPMHTVLILGVDTSDQVYYYDVSDRLAESEPRIKTMHIDDFNDRRNIPYGPGSGILTRSLIYTPPKTEA